MYSQSHDTSARDLASTRRNGKSKSCKSTLTLGLQPISFASALSQQKAAKLRGVAYKACGDSVFIIVNLVKMSTSTPAKPPTTVSCIRTQDES
jgi:hypothetical protein